MPKAAVSEHNALTPATSRADKSRLRIHTIAERAARNHRKPEVVAESRGQETREPGARIGQGAVDMPQRYNVKARDGGVTTSCRAKCQEYR